jgi:hypothetical protein
MRRTNDIVAGQTFGRWTTVEAAGSNRWGLAMWVCVCECGTTRAVLVNRLLSGLSASCGCNRGRAANLLGRQFGSLLVIDRGVRPQRLAADGAWWVCRCDCGVVKLVAAKQLNQGQKTCGCGPNSYPKNDLVGQRFGWLTVIELVGVKKYAKDSSAVWRCRCDCGKIVERTRPSLVRVRRKGGLRYASCGCGMSAANTTHGKSKSREYKRWQSMMGRCFTRGTGSYLHYGKRGIVVCAAWRTFEAFQADMGCAPSQQHSLDRKDVNGNYSCGKCEECLANGWSLNLRWATKAEQGRNKRTNRLISYGGVTLCLADWADRTGLTRDAIRGRLNMGWSIERALSTPPLPGTRSTQDVVI